ncbi:Uncharacterised protein [Brucella suis]|nr:hypothetical protein DO74_1 [Brucella abortus bv. 6 str. 870]SPU78525.1 Uncharacterised protein [Brucella suis]
MAHFGHGFGQVFLVHHLQTLLEDHLALIVHHIVIFEKVLADFKVARLDLFLRLFKRLVDPGVDDGFVFLEAEFLQHAVHAVGTEDAHQIVLQRQEEF